MKRLLCLGILVFLAVGGVIGVSAMEKRELENTQVKRQKVCKAGCKCGKCMKKKACPAGCKCSKCMKKGQKAACSASNKDAVGKSCSARRKCAVKKSCPSGCKCGKCTKKKTCCGTCK